MTSRALLFTVAFLTIAVAGCTSDRELDDAGPTGLDSGPDDRDTGVRRDTGVTPGEDSGPTPGDDGGPSDDDGGADVDAGTDDDAGEVPVEDAGTIVDDGGTTESDAGLPDTCTNETQDGDETDVDCGGDVCSARCEATESCDRSADCASRVCISGSCIAASCTDGVTNGDETDRDCGGSCDDGCANGRRCMGQDDCASASAMCTGGFCQPGACVDGVRNGAETAIDCGGGTCAPCDDGEACALPRDCASSICIDALCLPLECTNGAMDGGEVGVDCGGPCPGCPAGTACSEPTQCLSERCEGDVCASCSDDVRSGAETDVDCGGGVCEGCSRDGACLVDADCAFGDCLDDGTCDGPAEYYREDFEGGAGGWTTAGTLWELGTPTKETLNAAHSGVNAWVTDLADDYPTSASTSVESPPIDLSAAPDDPAIEIAVFYATESCCDELVLEVSTDGGTSWDGIGAQGSGVNWYNTSDGWAGTSGGWLVARNVLTGTAGESDVRVRLHFNSDGSIQNEGVAFDDIVIRAPIPNLTVAVEAVPDVCGQVAVSVTNTGELVIPSATFQYGIDGAAQTSVTLTDFAPGATEARTLFADDGDVVRASVSGAADANPTDDEASVTLSTVAIPVNGSSPYAEDFEASDGGWITVGTNSSWEHGAPADTVIDTADSGTNAWVTNLDGDYNASEDSFLVSPCLDAQGSTADLRVSFAHIFETSTSDDGWLDYSVDGGLTWQRVVGGPNATNWYNDTTNDEWDGSSGGSWRDASATLLGSAGKPGVRVRFAIDTTSLTHDEGFGVDTVSIQPSGMPDLSVEVRRTASCGSADVAVINSGTATVSAYALTLVADGVETRATILDPLLPGEEAIFRIDALTEAGAYVEAPGDIEPGNDADAIFTSIPIVGGYFDDFAGGDGGFIVSGANATWAFGAPGGTFISGPASDVNAWVTELEGTYSPNEHSYLTSPCFDLSALGADPELAFSHIFQTESCCDHGWVEVSIDGGETWRKVGRGATGMNWYDDPILDWWSGTSGAAGAWRTASHLLSGTAGHDQVRVRFVMYSDPGVEGEGFGVDDFAITP